MKPWTPGRLPSQPPPPHGAKGYTARGPRRRDRHREYRPADLAALRAAAALFEGRHNFAAFAQKNTEGKAASDPFRTVHRVTVVDEGGGNVRMDFYLGGALHKMVRNIVGTCLAVAVGKCERARRAPAARCAAPVRGRGALKSVRRACLCQVPAGGRAGAAEKGARAGLRRGSPAALDCTCSRALPGKGLL
jgi:hypothetical protein